MLFKDDFIVKPLTFQLIQKLQRLPELNEFYLVGGTSLALQLGHRNSIDIDLFSRNEFEPIDLLRLLDKDFLVTPTFQRKGTLLSVVNGIKVDFVRHDFSLINPPKTEEGITYLGLEDIAAMKLNAISNSGKRIKDFIDIYFLLEHFSMDELIGFYAAKYPKFNPLIALKSVNYFDDIDPELDPPKLKTPLPLIQIKARIDEAVVNSKMRFG